MNKRIFKHQTTDTGEIPFYKIGTFGKKPDAFISKELFDEYKLNYPYPKIGDLLISASGSIGRVVEYTGKKEYFQDSNIVWLEHDQRLDNSFLKQFYNIVKWQGLEGSTIKRLYNKNILETKIKITNPKEQSKIGTLFKKLDSTIALHQQKLAQLELMKKGFLQQLFPENGEKVPKVRFANFEGDWEQRKLGEVSSAFSGGTPSAEISSFYRGDIPFIRSGEINSDKTELFLTEEGLNNSSAKIVEIGDILYALYGATSGEVGISKINGAINQAILAIRPSEKYLSQFIMQWLKFQKPQIVEKYLQGGQGNLSGAIVKDLILTFPKYEEQTKIASFFKQLDQLLTLHQQKIDKLKLIKKAFLQKMFI